MNINDQYISSVNSTLTNSSNNTKTKSLADYMNESDKGSSSSLSSSVKSYFSDTVTLSKEAYAAIREYDPTMLASLGYQEEETTAEDGSSTNSRLDSVQFSKEAYAALKERNPELLESLGYNLDEV